MTYSETIYFVENVATATEAYLRIPDATLIEKSGTFWALLNVNGARLGLLEKSSWKSEHNPAPRIAFRSTDIAADATVLIAAGFEVEEIKSGKDMESTTFRDTDGNAFFVWQDTSGNYVTNS